MWRALAAIVVVMSCQAAETALLQVEATLDSGTEAGKKIPVTLAYDPSQVAPKGDSTVDATLVGDRETSLQKCEAVFHDGLIQSVRLFLRMESPDSPVHNLVIGLAGANSMSYVDQNGGLGSGTFRVRPIPNSNNITIQRPIPQPLDLSPAIRRNTNPGNPGLVILAPELPGANPLNIVHPPAAPGLVVVDPAPLTLHVPPPPPPLK
jgi:hypothetical protein